MWLGFTVTVTVMGAERGLLLRPVVVFGQVKANVLEKGSVRGSAIWFHGAMIEVKVTAVTAMTPGGL